MINNLKKDNLDYNISNLPDTIVGQSDYLKEYFDKNIYQFIKEAFNPLIDALLNNQANNSGADNVGSGPIKGVAGNTIQEKLIDLKQQLSTIVLGDIPNYSITSEKLKDNSISTEKIMENSITTEKIMENSITTEKFRDNSINSAKIQNSCITANKFASNINKHFQGQASYSVGTYKITVVNEGYINYTLSIMAPANYNSSDTYMINGAKVILKSVNNTPLSSAWVIGAKISFEVVNNIIYFR